MAKYLIPLILITVFSLLSCNPITTEPPDFGTAYAGWISIFVSNFSSQDIGVKYYLFIADKDKSNVYTASSINEVIKMGE